MTEEEMKILENERKLYGAINQNVIVCSGCKSVVSFPNNDSMKDCIIKIDSCNYCPKLKLIEY